MASDGLDFDLEGLELDAPVAVASVAKEAPQKIDPVLDLNVMDFDFLDDHAPSNSSAASEAGTLSEVPFAMEAAPEIVFPGNKNGTTDDLPDILAPTIATPLPQESTTNKMDFDLSNITLELDPAATLPGANLLASVNDGVEANYSSMAEMSTKLDLALAYQEIGDKEGARELLDEVLKDGTPEQSEKARELLASIG